MRSALKASLPILAILALLSTAAPLQGATNSVKVALPAGVTELTVGNADLVVTASAPVTVHIVVTGKRVYGTVDIPVGSSTAPFVTIVLLGEPDETIFQGKVSGPTPFDSIKPHETGHVDL